MKLPAGPDHYFDKSYDEKEYFISYWHQIYEVINLNPKKVLEIGIGNGFVSDYLKKRAVDVTTLDIDKRLNPDLVGNILNLPFKDSSFCVVVCYEVLEHLPYENFLKILSEIFRVSKSYVILSLPDTERAYRFIVHIPRIGEIKKLITLPKSRKPIHEFDGRHYWEIGKAGYPLARIINDIKEENFEVEKTYRVFEHPYHRFFILKKRWQQLR